MGSVCWPVEASKKTILVLRVGLLAAAMPTPPSPHDHERERRG